MNRLSLAYPILLIVLLSACNKPDRLDASIRFDVDVPATKTGTFINNESTDLRNACTPAPSGRGQGIGIWAEMYRAGEVTPVRNVFSGVRLLYQTGAHDSQADHLSWNTDQNLYWSPGERYYFRAYYPDSLVPAGNSTASVLFIDYRPEQLQEDLMFAYWHTGVIYFSGDTPSGSPLPYTSTSTHIPLQFHHALSALKFKFKYSYPNEDHLTACWLENTGSSQFQTFGMLAYGSGGVAAPSDDEVWDRSTTPDQVGREQLQWFQTVSPAAGARLYEWAAKEGYGPQMTGPRAGANPGDPELPAVDCSAYSTAPANTQTGSVFIENEGWIYIIPQAIPTGTQICFMTQNNGDFVYRVPFPASVGGDSSFLRAKRYEITLTINASDVDALITILPWNKVDAYHSIDFSD